MTSNMMDFDADFLGQTAEEGRANAWPVVEDGEYLMVCSESVLVQTNDKKGTNWKLTFLFPENSAEREEHGKLPFRTWITLNKRNFPRVEKAFEALYDEEWEPLSKDGFLDMVKHAAGRQALVTLEVAPHFLAEKDKAMKDAKQNNITALASPVLAEEDNDEPLFSREEFTSGFGN